MSKVLREKRRLIALLIGVLLIISELNIYSLSLEKVYATTNTGDQFIAFTSDVHNKTGDVSATRLGNWIDNVEEKYGYLDYMGFCGDMADSQAGNTYWDLVETVFSKVDDRGIPSCFTTGNHEYDHRYDQGAYASNLNDTTKRFTVGAAPENLPSDANYKLYCLGSASKRSEYTQNQRSALLTFLNNAGDSKPIIILSHYPLHYFRGYETRETTGASDVISLLNSAATTNNQTIVFLWGHNHSISDSHYGKIYKPNDTIKPSSNSAETEINFYYASAGCMCDTEYSNGSSNSSIKGKGLVIQVKGSDKSLRFGYFDESSTNWTNGTTWTNGGTDIETQSGNVSVNGVNINKSTLPLSTGDTEKLIAKVTPSNATNRNINWSCSPSGVVTVENGVVTAVGAGTTTITATSAANSNYKATCTVTVNDGGETGDTEEYVQTDTLQAGNVYLIASGNSGSVYLLSSEAVTGSSSGQLKGVSATVTNGKVTITESAAAKTVFSCILENNNNEISTWLKNGSKYLYTDSSTTNGGLRMVDAAVESRYWHYKAKDGNTDKNLLWFFNTSKDGTDGYESTGQSGFHKYYLNVNNGNFESAYIGNNAKISTATGIPKMYLFTKAVPVTGIGLDKDSLELATGETGALVATIQPSNATNKGVVWSSSDESKATVDDKGKVTAVSAGTVKITAESAENGEIKAECNVTVTAASTVDYVLTDTLQAGKEYLIVSGNSGRAYMLSNQSGNTLKGIAANIVDGKISITSETAASTLFAAEGTDDNSIQLKLGGQYLYANSSGTLRFVDKSTIGTSKFWHYKAEDNGTDKHLLWLYEGSDGDYGYTGTNKYKYYLQIDKSNGNFSKGELGNIDVLRDSTIVPKMYLFTKAVPVTGISLDKDSLELAAGETGALVATIQPSNATNKGVVWSSSDESKATVDQEGNVTAVSAGTVKITAESAENKDIKAECNVTVTAASTVEYVLTDTLQAGNEYLIANGNSGNVYLLSSEAGGSKQLKGVSATVTNGKVTITESVAAKTVFTCEQKVDTNPISTLLKNGTKYLYTDSSQTGGLRMDSAVDGRYWHYKAMDGSTDKHLLWFFNSNSDSNGTDGYESTGQSGFHKYYLTVNNGNFESAYIGNNAKISTATGIPKMYLFTKSEESPHVHTYSDQAVPEVPATCTSDGTKAYYTCSGCTSKFLLENGEYKEASETDLVIKGGHKYSDQAVPEVPATCTENGTKAYYTCSGCNNKFLYENGEYKVASESDLTIDKLNHSWDYENIAWTWASNYSSATATLICKNDNNHKEGPIQATVTSQTSGTTITYTATITGPDGNAYKDIKTSSQGGGTPSGGGGGTPSGGGGSSGGDGGEYDNVQKVIKMILELPDADKITIADKAAVYETKKAFDVLTDIEKGLISAKLINKLENCVAAEQAIEYQKAVDDVILMIQALPEPENITEADKDAVNKTKAAYEALTDAQKALIPVELTKKLTDCITAEEAAEETARKKAEDQKAAEAVTALIIIIPDDFSKASRDDVKAARDAYDALTDDQKALVDAQAYKKLESAEYYFAKKDAKARKAKLKSVKAKKGKKAVAKWRKETAANGYQFVYSRNKKFKKGNKKVTIKKYKTVKKTVKKLKAKKRYYFRIRTYNYVYNPGTSKMEKVYGKWSNVKKIKAKK